MSKSVNVLRRLAAATALTMVGTLLTTAPAQAAVKPAVTHLKVAATPTTALVGSLVAVSGSVTPVTSTPVAIQRFNGLTWTTITHVKPGKTGLFAVDVRVSKKPGAWILRATRAASRTAKPGISAHLHLRLAATGFAIAATPSAANLSAATPLVVSGAISPPTSGTVTLQRKTASGSWVSYTSAKLGTGSVYAITTPLVAGSYEFRVVKAFTSSVAAGASRTFGVTVTPASPVVSTAALPPITVGVPYSATLTATLGTTPYAWSLSGGALPVGLTLSAAGVISGRPLASGAFSATVTVTDSGGRTGSLTGSYAVHPVGVKAWGLNGQGVLGDGTDTTSHNPVTDGLPDGIETIAGDLSYSLALRTDGTVWATGANQDGQLGINSLVDTDIPVQIPSLTGVIGVAAGLTSGYAVKSDGTVWAWGENNNGELGNGTTSGTPSQVPVQVSGISNAVAVAAGDTFALALLANGSVVAWGRGDSGQLGNGTTTLAQDTPVPVSGIGPSTTKATAISAGLVSSYALLADGTVRSWGSGLSGALGNGTTTDQDTPGAVSGLTGITAIAASGFEGGYALHAGGTVSAWGYGGYGELGNGATSEEDAPVAVTGLTGIAAIAGGRLTGYALSKTGVPYAWGYDSDGELGDGIGGNTDTAAAVPGLTDVVTIAAGQSFAFAIVGP